jgi:deoxyribodipyrimidine photo-lyase
MKSLFLFRRDLRLHDNTALINLCSHSAVSQILPIFIFDPFQINQTPQNKWYRSIPAIQFLIESLDDLQNSIRNTLNSRLVYFYNNPLETLKIIHKQYPFQILAFNRDYSEYSLKRDKLITDWCNEMNIQIITDSTNDYEHSVNDDLTLHPMSHYIPDSGKPYVIFGAFYKRAIKLAKPMVQDWKNSYQDKFQGFPKKKKWRTEFSSSFISHQSGKFSCFESKQLYKPSGEFTKNIHSFYNNNISNTYQPVAYGGRSNALEIIHNIHKGQWSDYPDERDNLSYSTTHLSGYLKFGCISIREVYEEMKKQKMEILIRQLYWRSYFFVLSRFVHIGYEHSDPFFANIHWRNDEDEAKQMWVEARTGFPVIDACVRELITTGYLHNRGRLLVANFSIKMLHIDPFHPHWGGQVVFSRLLLDNCYANNFGNWNNALGPYDLPGFRFGKKGTRSGRIFRDIVKFQKWDRTLAYIRKYIPELSGVPDKDIYRWNTQWKKYKDIVDYPAPMIDFDKRIQEYFHLTLRK